MIKTCLLVLAFVLGLFSFAAPAGAAPTPPPLQQATQAPPPPNVGTQGINIGTAICSINSYCYNSNGRVSILLGEERYGQNNQIVSANGQFRAYVHGQTCRITVERVSNHQVLWASPNAFGCGRRDSNNTSYGYAQVRTDGQFINTINYYNTSSGSSNSTAWNSGSARCRGASSGLDLVMMNEGFIALWTQSYSVIGRQQIWNMNYNGHDQNGTLGCK